MRLKLVIIHRYKSKSSGDTDPKGWIFYLCQMRKLFTLSFIFLLICICAKAQSPARIKIGDLMQRLEDKDTLYVVNFWATWCPPCVAELPEFNRADTAWAGKAVKIILVSLDFPESWPVKLNEFLTKKQIHPEVVWLDETDANIFIPPVSPHWSGSIPATLISCKATHTREFKESKIDFIYLNEQIRNGLLH